MPETTPEDEPVVYLVTAGSYSDYRVERAFLDAPAAEAYAEAMNVGHPYDSREVEEYPITREVEVRDCLHLSCQVRKDGTADSVYDQLVASDDGNWVDCVTSVRANADGHPSSPGVHVWVSGFDHERVRKRYSELVAETKASWEVIVASACANDEYLSKRLGR